MPTAQDVVDIANPYSLGVNHNLSPLRWLAIMENLSIIALFMQQQTFEFYLKAFAVSTCLYVSDKPPLFLVLHTVNEASRLL
jgi:hypothetical protein